MADRKWKAGDVGYVRYKYSDAGATTVEAKVTRAGTRRRKEIQVVIPGLFGGGVPTLVGPHQLFETKAAAEAADKLRAG
jgi:hypothetical protein